MKIDIDTGEDVFEAELADSFLKKFVGMRFRRDGKMLFSFVERKPFIDMFFVPENLQLIFIDGDKKVSEVIDAKPWRIYRPSKPAKYLLESFETLDLEKGDEIDFQI